MRLSFRSILVAVLLGFLVCTVSIVGIASYLSAKESAEDLSSQVMNQVAERIDKEIHSVLHVAVAQSELNQKLLARGKLDLGDCEQVAAYFLEAMEVHKLLTFLSLTRHADGSYCHVMRNRDGRLTVRFLVREPDGRLSLTDLRPDDARLIPFYHVEDKSENDPRPRPYYQAVLERGGPTWTETYIFFGAAGVLDVPGVTYGTPIYGPKTKKLEGVLSADFDLYALSAFLSTLQIVKNGFAFVVEYRKDGTRRVIAHPQPEMLTRPVVGAEGREAMRAEELEDHRVRQFVGSILADTPYESVSNVGRGMFDVDGVPFVGAYHRLAEGEDLRWVICIAVPQSDILARVNANTRFQVTVGLLSFAAAIVLALFVAALISKPLSALAHETEAIGKFHLDPTARQPGRVSEIQRLSSAVEDMKTSLRSFRKFVPADLVRGLLASGEEASLGGKRRELTVYFSDLAGFTSISERLEPEELVQLLSEYLDAMTTQILDNGGTVDKYIGDAIMAFWGAPNPNAEHALTACRTALKNQERLRELRAEWSKRGLPEFHARIGLHTGEAIVGNIGSEARLDYTAIGDTVNLASRLEGLNKPYGTHLMISETTYAQVKDHVVARPLDKVSVKGKAQGVFVYELLAMREDATEQMLGFVEAYRAALNAYLAQRWADAVRMLEDFLKQRPTDGPALVLLARCREYQAEPPGSDWDGVHRMTTK